MDPKEVKAAVFDSVAQGLGIDWSKVFDTIEKLLPILKALFAK